MSWLEILRLLPKLWDAFKIVRDVYSDFKDMGKTPAEARESTGNVFSPKKMAPDEEKVWMDRMNGANGQF